MNSNFEIKGEWFLPSNKTNRVFGTLHYNSNAGASLELLGSLNGESFFPELSEHDFILGLSNDSRLITLHNCFMTKSGGAKLVKGQESGLPTTIYTVKYILIGSHIENNESLKFNRISAEIFNLDEWVGISGFKHKPFDFDKLRNNEFTVDYKLPEQIEFQINKDFIGRFNFVSNSPGWSRFQKNINISQRVEFQVESQKEKSLREFLGSVFRFQNFLILAFYKSTFPTSIYLTGERHKKDSGDGKKVNKKIELYFSISNRNKSTKPMFDMEMLFDYHRIKDEFPEIVKNWYAKHDSLEPAFNLLFEQFYNGNRFTENTFLNLAQASETFHARIHNHTRIPKEDYQKMKEEILKVTSKEYHGWLNDQFSFGNNLNLHSRLSELVSKYSNEITDKIITDKELFIKQVKHSRNYYTHYSEKGKRNALKGQELFFLSEKLKVLLVCAILMEVGFTKEKLTKLLDNIKWKNFNHIADWK